ncbi:MULTISPECIES: bifunctional homocysteine S-methyltransferase/methylenetetrahydrofolate reductase [Bacillus]|uniref:bifunctional homocysteine S-methyltransferase/methylenetetrahydrofolate reductase n=1 Tax=Bacillus TaxID=1386 RepID=UPI0002F5A791|nr:MULTISPECIES: bifunctional homocysteine S-methyltransferase/methylenetetrahydrofolate reductase [Bacillus]
MNFRDEIQKRILIGEGAMGTLLYATGVDQCFEELNITNPGLIKSVHQAYVIAGSEIIQSNTYGANHYKLKRFGLEDQVSVINREGMKIARSAANEDCFVFGTIGATRSLRKSDISIDEIKRNFREQLFSLLLENPDGIILETYYDFEEMESVLKIARQETTLPIIANVSLHEIGYLQNGMHLSDALERLEELGADVVGVNCRLGPYHTIRSFEQVPLFKKAVLSAYPNASLPEYLDGKLKYEENPEYFGKSSLLLREQGVRVIGGCCGTTPKHIEEVKKALKGLEPITEKRITPRKVEVIQTSVQGESEALYEKARKQRTILVELDPPKVLNTSKYMEGAKALMDAGADTITMADNSLASPRISNMALGSKLQQHGINPLIHLTCRDHNLIGLQSHLMGLHTLGMDEILVITGDPSKVGDFPGATSVYDVSSMDLISLIKQYNQGVSYSGKSLGQKTNFKVAAAFNPNVKYLHKAVARMEKKISCGADSFLTQPIYSVHQVEEIYQATKHLSTPIFLGIMPLTSYRNAEFIHHEVPGITLPESVLQAMAKVGDDRVQAELEGIAIAKELVEAAMERFNGIYLITPFLRYNMTAELTQFIRTIDAKQKEEVSVYE